MRIPLPTLIFLLAAISVIPAAYASGIPSEPATRANDTVPSDIERQLDEVVVTASDRFMNASGAVYIPDRKAKKSASDGVSLLSRIGIPSLRVDQLSGSVMTTANEGVDFFIDYMPADSREVANLRPMEVQKVEVLDYPKDPRFNGAQHVVNYILVKYEYGGYTKAHTSQTFNDYMGTYQLYSKLSVRKMTYDLSAVFSDITDRHQGSETEERFGFADGEVRRLSSTDASRLHRQTWTGAFRAIYQDKRAVIRNTLSLTGSRTPRDGQTDRTSYVPGILPDGQVVTSRTRRSISGSWQGDYRFFFPRGWYLNLVPDLKLGHNKAWRDYTSGSFSLVRNADEDTRQMSLSATGQKSIGKQAVSAEASAFYDSSDLSYTGSTQSRVTNRHTILFGRLRADLTFSRLYLLLTANVKWIRECTDGIVNCNIRPGFNVYGQYSFSQKLNVSLGGNSQTYATSFSQTAPALVMQDILSGQVGNAAITSWNVYTFYANLNWFASRRFSFNAYLTWADELHPVVNTYHVGQWDGREVVIMRPENRGHRVGWDYGVNATARFLGNSLVAQAGVGGRSFSMKDTYIRTATYPAFNANVQYMTGNWTFSGNYSHRYQMINQLGGSKGRSQYYLSAGWSNGDLSVEAYWVNFLTGDRSSGSQWLDTPVYSQSAVNYGAWTSNWVRLNLTYSFSYGKKMQRGQDEVSAGQGPQSAIVN